MKFVHITRAGNLSRIKASGLRTSNCYCGRGVYAMPLLHFESLHERQIRDLPCLQTRESTGAHWKFLYSKHERGADRVAAVVFRVPAECWPIHYYIDSVMPPWNKPFWRDVGETIGADLQIESEEGTWLGVSEEDRSKAVAKCEERAHLDYGLGELGFRVRHARALGRLLHAYKQAGEPFYVGVGWDQAVIPHPIPARCIGRIVPLYRTSAKFKAVHRGCSNWAE